MSNGRNDYLTILGNGEFYLRGYQKSYGGGGKAFPLPYDDARSKVQSDIAQVRETLSSTPSHMRLREFVVCFRMYPEFLAKSYHPDTLLGEQGLVEVGSRRWHSTHKPATKRTPLEQSQEDPLRVAKMVFVRTNDTALDHLSLVLDRSKSSLAKSFREDIQKIEAITTLSPDERLLGFDPAWNGGSVELILHPFGSFSSEAIEKLKHALRQSGVEADTLQVRPYPGGPVFVGANLNRSSLLSIAEFNPLRTAHPLSIAELPEVRASGAIPTPPPPLSTGRSSITVGVFDGGLDEVNPLTRGFSRLSKAAVPSAPAAKGIAHGTSVTGAILYGPLNDYSNASPLPTPPVSVEVFRVLPRSRPADIDLYEAIDFIEQLVPQRNDIRVYNLSFGPKGSILDDDISRFTYVLDGLAYEHRVLFVAAAGNGGGNAPPANRIQSPSDMVNGLEVL